ncbi:MAG: DUF1217 domain-containing protein [Paracoccaceae bacterium]
MFAPIVPVGGVAGLRFVERTYDRQFELFQKSPEIERDVEAFRERAGRIATAEEFVRDTAVLRVALGAFGLEEELPKRAFIRRIIEDGTLDPSALANRLAAPQWQEFSRTLGFGDVGNLLISEAARERIVEDFRVQAFEKAIGDANVDVRLALNFTREIDEIGRGASVDRIGWFEVLGKPPLRRVVELAFSLPQQFGLIDIDQQRDELASRSRRLYGGEDPSVFLDPTVRDDLIRRFLARSAADTGPSIATPGAAALQLIQGAGLGPSAQAGLFASNFL